MPSQAGSQADAPIAMPEVNKKPLPSEDPWRSFKFLLKDLYTKWVKMTYPFFGVRPQRLSIHYSCDLSRRKAGRIQLGNDVELHRDAWINIEAPAVGDTPVLILEDGCVIGRRSQISVKNGLHLERDVITGANVLIMDHNHAYEDITRPIKVQGITGGGKIRIGAGTWVGQGATIMCSGGDLTIGKHCVIAANAVVIRSFPAYSVISGNPARVVRQYDPAAKAWVLGSSKSASENA